MDLDALIVLMMIAAAVLVIDALAISFGHDSRSIGDDDWATPWSSGQPSQTECS